MSERSTSELRTAPHFDVNTLPRLSRNQQEEAVGRLGAGQSAQVVANPYNVNAMTIYRLQHRYNTTNTTNGRPRRGCPRVTTLRQNRFILRQHLQGLFTITTGSARHTTGTQQRLVTADTARCRLASTISIVDVLLEVLFLQTVTDRIDCSGPQLVNIGAISNGEESSFQMKVGSVLRRRMAENGSGEEEVNVTQMHVWWRETHRVSKASWFGEPSVSHKAGPVIFQNISPGRGNGVTALGPHQHHMFQQDNARAHTTRATRDFLQQHKIRIMPWPAFSPDLNTIVHLWDGIQRNLIEVRPRLITAADLSVAFLRIRAAIPIAFINRFKQRKVIEVRPRPITAADLSVAFLRIRAAIPIAFINRFIERKLIEVWPRPITAADLSVAFLRIRAAIPIAFINRLINRVYVANAQGVHSR